MAERRSKGEGWNAWEKLDRVLSVCNPSTPAVRWEQREGNLPDPHKLASLDCVAQQK